MRNRDRTIAAPAKRALVALLALLLAACAGNSNTVPAKPTDKSFNSAQLAKTDVDRIAETHQREIFSDLRILTEKLYRRNPREWKKSGHATIEAAVARIFEGTHNWQYAELDGKRGTDAIFLAFRPDYTGDRVLAYVAGIGSMIQTAFNDKTAFFVLDDLQPQALYNAARNVEIAVWKLSNARDAKGTLFLLSNEGPAIDTGATANLSFEREFGKIIGSLDVLSQIAADKDNRTVVKIIQNLATAVFLPIKF